MRVADLSLMWFVWTAFHGSDRASLDTGQLALALAEFLEVRDSSVDDLHVLYAVRPAMPVLASGFTI